MKIPSLRIVQPAYPRRVPLAALALLFAAAPLGASLVRECSLLTLHRKAGAIFHGRCVASREIPDGLPVPYTEYTFKVIRAAKGCRNAAGKTLETVTFRHAGARAGRQRPDGLEAPGLGYGVPKHEVGEEAVLFLTRESSSGLCAPVGLDQGKLPVLRKEGRLYVKNSRGKRLFDTVEATAFHGLTREEADVLRSEEDLLDLERFITLCGKVRE